MSRRGEEVSAEASFAVVVGLDLRKLEEVRSDGVPEGIVLLVFWEKGLNEMGFLSDDEIQPMLDIQGRIH